MKIVVLDGYTLNPGDLSWEKLELLGDCVIHERTSPEDVLIRSQNAEIILTNKTVLNRETINRLPELRYIGVLATGCNIVDVTAARDRNIIVTNVPTYGTQSVAQMTFAHILNLVQRVGDHSQSTRVGNWAKSADWCYWDYPLVELADLTIGIVGFGRIGSAVACIAQALGMKVVTYNEPALSTLPPYVQHVELDTLFESSDVVSLHCPLTDTNRNMVDRRRLSLMKPTAFLVNTSRGPLIDEPALAEALDCEQIAGAGLDVLVTEPPVAGNPLLAAKNCYVTPHIAWATKAARRRLMEVAVHNVSAFLAGEAENIVK